MKPSLSVREIEPGDIGFIIDYWINADEQFLNNMGADIKKSLRRMIGIRC